MHLLDTNQKQASASFFDKDDIVAGHDIKYWIDYYFKSFLWPDWLRSREKVYTLPTNLEQIPQPKSDYRIKQDKAILLPAGKLVAYAKKSSYNDNEEMMKQKMRERVISGMDAFSDFNIFLDGELVSAQCFRQMSDYFKIPHADYMALCDAYWLFIKPYVLTKNKHNLSTYIACSQEQTRISLNYNLQIV